MNETLDPAGVGRRVLLTGARGFTGDPMRQELEAHGYAVVGTVIHGPSGDDYRLDLTSPAECAAVVEAVAPDFVVHLAAISFVQHADAADFYHVNVVGTTNLLDALVAAPKPVRKVLLASSANVYGNAGSAAPLTEAQPMVPANHYAASKMAMEMMAATYFDRLPILLTRPFNYTGVGQSTSFLVPKIVAHFARGDRSIELGNTDIARDFSDVRMLVSTYRRLLETALRSRAFNVCTGVATSLREIIGMMQCIAGYEIEVQTNPAFVRDNDIRQLTGDPAALIAAIGALEVVPMMQTLSDMYLALR